MKTRITKVLLPSEPGERTWNAWNYFALWIGMNIAVATYTVVNSYMQKGLAAWQVILSIFIGCMVLMFPMGVNGHAGAKYGFPSPVYWRSTCGYRGSSATAIIRAVVAVFYFGIHLNIGAECVDGAIRVAFPGWTDIPFSFGISFGAYWLLTLWVLIRGSSLLKKLESYTAPFLILWSVVLVVWARVTAGDWGELAFAPATVTGSEVATQMLVCVTATIGWWATLVLNITDFTRYAKDQKSHLVGTAIGNPVGFCGLALVGVLVTSCSAVIFGSPVWDPIELTSRMGNPIMVIGMLIFLGLAEITTNTAANAWAPCMDISTVTGGKLSFKWAVIIFGVVSLITQPWKVMGDAQLYIDGFLVCSGAFLAPLAGINIANYWFIKKTKLNMNALYDPEGEYAFTRLTKYCKPFAIVLYVLAVILLAIGFVANGEYLSQASALGGLPIRWAYLALGAFYIIFATLLIAFQKGGYNPVAFFTIAISVGLTFIGVFIPSLSIIYSGAWFVATIGSILIYYFLMKALDPEFNNATECLELDRSNIEVVE